MVNWKIYSGIIRDGRYKTGLNLRIIGIFCHSKHSDYRNF